MPRHIKVIVAEIKNDWKNINPYALAYLDVMLRPLSNHEIQAQILYFLSNAATWRGEVARRVKTELRSML